MSVFYCFPSAWETFYLMCLRNRLKVTIGNKFSIVSPQHGNILLNVLKKQFEGNYLCMPMVLVGVTDSNSDSLITRIYDKESVLQCSNHENISKKN